MGACRIAAGDSGPAVLSGNVFAADRQLFGGFDAHLDAAAGAAEQGDLNGSVGEQLFHGHAAVHPVRGLDHDGFIGAATEDEHGSSPCQGSQRP